jgi:hypothetical protein
MTTPDGSTLVGDSTPDIVVKSGIAELPTPAGVSAML